MYYHPFWLITSDPRNSSIADALQEEFDELEQQKKTFYASLSDNSQLFKLLEIRKNIFKVLVLFLRTNSNILNSKLEGIDWYRVSEKIKRILHTTRLCCTEQVHEFDVFSFIDSLHQRGKWEDSELESIRELGSNFLSRMSQVHQHYSGFVDSVEMLLVSGNSVHYNLDEYVKGSYQLLKDTEGYSRLINSL